MLEGRTLAINAVILGPRVKPEDPQCLPRKYSVKLIHALQTSLMLIAVLPVGTASGAVRSGRRTGASDGG
jgi:hypothetical protein